MSSKTLVKIIIFLVFVVVVGTPLFYIKQGVFPFILSKTMFFQAVVEILFALWIVLAISDKRYRPRRTPLLTGLYIYLGVLLVTSFFGVDFWRSFWSTYERAFGIFTILHLAAFTVVLTSLKDELPWKKIFYVSLGVVLVTDVLAVLQTQVKNLLLEEPVGRTGTTFGNPTFLAGYLLFHVFIGTYLIIDKLRSVKERWKNRFIHDFLPYFYLISVVFFTTFVLIVLTQTRGDILGLGAGIFTLLILFSFRPPGIRFYWFSKRWLYAAAVFVIIASGGVFWITRDHPSWANIPGLNRFRDISLESEALQPRLIAARAAWQGFLDRPLTGWGWDNFNVAFNKYYDPQALRLGYQETRFDKPHNFLLENLVAGGLPLALSHLALLGFLVFQAMRLRDKVFGQIVTAALVGYFVRSLFIFDTLGPALMLYLILGIVDGEYRKEIERGGLGVGGAGEEKTEKKVPPIVNKYLLFFSLLAALVFAYKVNVRTIEASYNHFRGFVDMAHGRVQKGIDNFRRTLDTWSPYRWNFVRDYAAVMSEVYFYNPDIIPQGEVLYSIGEMEKVARDHPKDAYNHYALVDMYNQISDIDLEKFLSAAEREAAIALELSPDRQEIYFSLAKTKTLRGNYAAATELLDKALELDDQVADAHFYYGVVAFAAGDVERGYRELRIAMDMGRPWKTFYEPQTVANFFADSGHLDEAIELYEVALGMRPEETETKIKLGVAYFFAGNHDLARSLLEEAGEKFDFKTSVAFSELKPILDRLGVVY